MRHFKTMLLATAGAVIAAPMIGGTAVAQDASAEIAQMKREVVSRGVGNVQLRISGQVNRALSLVDDGENTELFNVDNDNSSSRIRLQGRANFSDDLQLGTNFEVQFESNSTAAVNQVDEQGVGPNNFTERKIELFVRSKTFGKISLGQGDTASNGTSEQDLSRTTVIAYSGIGDMAGGMRFNDNDGNLLLTDIGDVFSNLDGLSRDDRIRYDTPTFAGFTAATSWGADDAFDVALRYAGEFGGIRVAAAAAFADGEDGRPGDVTIDERINGSASVLHTPTGLNVTFAAGQDELDGADNDPMFWYVKLGWIANFFQIGPTAFAIDYAYSEEVSNENDEGEAYGIFAVQHLSDWGAEFYTGIRNHDADLDVGGTEEILVWMTGARFKF